MEPCLADVDGVATGDALTPNILTNIVIPLGDQTAVRYDFAEAEPASVSGFVYRDDNDNAERNANEPGIGGVTVRLIPINTIAPQEEVTVNTAADGSYSFVGLSPGEYEVIEVNQPANLTDGRDTPGTIDGVVVGIADNPGDRLSRIFLDGGDDGIEYNFGELALGSIAGFVFLAAPGEDCDGDHDAPGNTPLPGVYVELQTIDGITVSQTTTLADGSYFFDDVPLGDYRIIEVTPEGLLDGSSHPGTIDGASVGDSIDGGLISSVTLTPGGTGIEYNFCEIAPATISGFVYEDDSDDGIKDAGESGIEGTIVTLVDLQGNVVATTTTDANGRYEFLDIPPGDYALIETQPSDYFDGIDTPGEVRGQTVGVPGNDGDSIRLITLKQGDIGTDFNFGELLGASLSGHVHSDLDGDCLIDPDEDLLEGVIIRLLDALGEEVARTTTDQNGQYTFTDIRPGEYTVVEEQPEGFFEGDARAGSAGGDVENSNRIGSVTLTSGEVAVDYDFCEHPPAEIIGSVFHDTNGDCLFDPHEDGIEGVLVELYDDSGQLIASTRTDAAGNYKFSNLPMGSYTIRETQPAGWLQGGQRAGSAGGDDSTEDVIRQIPVGWGERLTQYNFCELAPSSISGIVHVDGNGDCIQQDDEPPLAGVTIELLDASGTRIATTITDANGEYSFNNLRPGNYRIFEVQPDGFLQGGQVPGTGDGSVLGEDLLGVSLLSGQDLVEYNFCEVAPSSISGFVHVDNNGDCLRQDDEEPLEGVIIELYDADGNQIATTVTDASGEYSFDNLPPGNYRILEIQPDGFLQGGQVPGTGDGTVLGEDLLGVTLLSGQTLVDYNFCEVEPSSISGSVWEEIDLNRVFDPGEVPVPGVLVQLIDDSGEVVATTNTDSQGDYEFTQLSPGIYSVHESQPTDLFHGGEVVGSEGGEIGGDDLLIGIDLGGGVDAVNYDFPEVPPATLSGFIFQDGETLIRATQPTPEELREFRDGELTPDDTRLSGVEVELRNVLGRAFQGADALPGVYPDGPIRATTDADGFYEFTGLRPGAYHVYQEQPEGFVDSLDTPGTTGGIAVNPADTLDDADKIVVLTLSANEATNPHDDAILNVLLSPGQSSQLNNFSEIVVATLPNSDFLPEPEEENPKVLAPIQTFDPRVRLVVFASPPDVRKPITSYDEWAVSWHLSVINGGFPRGDADEGLIQGVSAKDMRENWDEGENVVGRWSLMKFNGEKVEDSDKMTLGVKDGTALAGDFDGDGRDEVAIFVAGQWFVDLNGNGVWDAGDLWIRLGTALDRPVVGDWDGDGKDDIGIFGRQWQRDPRRIKRDPGLPDPDNKRRREVDNRTMVAQKDEQGEDRERLLRRGNEGSLRADAVDHVFQYGEQVDTPIAGDWNGDGIDQIAVFRGGTWMLDLDGDGRWTKTDERANFGKEGDEPVVGDFNGDGIDELGVIRGDMWIIDTDGDRKITGNDKQIRVPRGSEDSQPIVGDWDGDGEDDPGYYDEAA